MIKVAPSILAADILRIENQIKMIDESGADYIHIDIMDGHYVPKITFGPTIVRAIKKITNKTLDVHLMITPVLPYIEEFIESGADIISFHPEADTNHNEIFEIIYKSDCKPAIAIHPDVTVKSIEHLLTKIKLVVVMTVVPGFGGQKFLESELEKIKQLYNYRKNYQLDFEIEVDGGVNDGNAKTCVNNGADVLVAGSYIFSKEENEYRKLIDSLR